jgi:ATP-dependent DNA helicase RecG
MDLIQLLTSPEGKSLEFKRGLESKIGILRTIVAFANTAGGTLLIGVKDGSRDLTGLENPLEDEERIASMIDDSIYPKLLPDLELCRIRERHILAITVYPSQSKPHYLIREGLEAGSYVRVGSTNRKADADLVKDMGRLQAQGPFDEQPLPELSSEAIDLELASELFPKRAPLTPQKMQSLRAMVEHQGKSVPTVAGLLLFGRSRLETFPDSWIQAGRFDGTDRASILDQASLKGPLHSSIEDAVGFLEKHLYHRIEIGRTKRLETWTVPPEALRELIVNAVIHSDYSQVGAPIRISMFDDRIEIENPGLLPFGLTLEDLPKGISKLRNRTIGRVFQELGLAEHWGSGIQRVLHTCKKAELPTPVWEEIGTRFRVTLPFAHKKSEKLSKSEQSILKLLSSKGGLQTKELAATLKISDRAVRMHLASLSKKNWIAGIGVGPRDPYRRYYLITGREFDGK